MAATARSATPEEVSDQASDEVTDALVQTSFAVMAVLNQVAADHDLSLTQLRVLAILRHHEPKMAELATHLGLEKSTVSGLVDRAAARGLVRRKANPDDARAVHVSLTAAGRRLAAQGGAEVAGLLQPVTAALEPTERQQLARLLSRLTGATTER